MDALSKMPAVESAETAFGADSGPKMDLLNFTRAELADTLRDMLGLEPFRARQLMQWMHRRRVRDFSEMTDISKPVREQLAERFTISRPKAQTVLTSSDGTRKFLFQLDDGSAVETVLIRQPSRWTLCVSSQVGCALGCTFCRTGEMGLRRHLQPSEIVGQVLAVKDHVAALRSAQSDELLPDDFSNIVFMGMGEPLHNLRSVIRAVVILNDNLGLNYSSRKITVSTSGLVPAIREFGASQAGANLAVSLNATTDEVRTRLMPVNKRWPIAVLLDALRSYPLKKGRRITVEYVLIGGINDSTADRSRLPRLLHGIPVKINLIPYNGNPAQGLQPPDAEVVVRWQEALLDAGLNSTIRWSKGLDISAACGQLATENERRKRRRPPNEQSYAAKG